jgi:HK97 family phage major capsid protein
MPKKQIKSKALTREFSLDRTSVDVEARTLPISFSSEHPVERWFGTEILDHSPDAVDLGRLNDGAPLLLGHSWDDQIGVVESASVSADKVGRAVVRFGKSARAEEILQDVIDGIRTKISVGYRIAEMVLEKQDKDAGDTYRATRWTPLEISIVPIPADPNVGVGRDLDPENEFINVRGLPEEEIHEEERIMPEDKIINVEEVVSEARKMELSRVREIMALGDKCGCAPEARQFVDNGKSAEEFRSFILNEKWGQKDNIREVRDNPEIGLTNKERKDYSFLRALNAAASGDWKDAGFELECSRAAAKILRRDPQGFFIPHDAMVGTRDYVSIDLTSHTGEKTVATDLLSGSFIEMLRNSMMVRQMGMRVLAGLVGDIAIPRQTGGATAYWLTEDSNSTDSIQAFDQLTMTPKTVSGQTQVTRKLLQQSSLDVEALIRQDLAQTLALAIDVTALHSDGTGNRPKGITGTSGIATVALGTNGAVPTYAAIVDMETQVAIDNALLGSVGYLTNAKARGKLKTTFINSTGGETPIWQKGEGPGWGEVNGYRAGVSNQVASNLVKASSGAVCSAAFFGNWADMIMGMWGGLDVIVDPYTGSSSGRVKVVMFQDCDILIRHAESFSVILDMLTT